MKRYTFILVGITFFRVLQYRKNGVTRWKKYPGKDKLERAVFNYEFRLLNKNKTKVLVEKGSYAKIMKRFRQIEFFKHR